PSEGIVHDLWAKALALEDAKGERAVLVTTDLIGFRGDYMPNRIRESLKTKYGLSEAEVALSSSHTHTGPELQRAPEDYLDDDNITGQYSPENRAKIKRYSEKLEDQIVTLVGDALDSMEPVQLFSGIGIARFAVNRRVYFRMNTLSKLAYALEGPVDHTVPVIKVQKSSGELLTVVFGYACHCTTIGIYKFSGDYAGFAQIALEEAFPGTTAMFFAGAGADQNPLPRGHVGYARQYGKTLAAAVESVLSEPMRELSPDLSTSYSKVDLGFANPPPTKDELLQMIEEASISKNWIYRTKVLIQKIDEGESLPTSYPYPVQFWKIGEQNMVILASEAVVDYAIRLKQIFGQDLFVMAYANEGMGYIPSTRVLSEGGYEGSRSALFTTPWAPDIEMKIVLEVIKLAEQAGINKSK
ncbi:neutral/alkaline non-lysosomal ceramidase N-terminal domain-containing protein, partial [Bacteroidota bacterium]